MPLTEAQARAAIEAAAAACGVPLSSVETTRELVLSYVTKTARSEHRLVRLSEVADALGLKLTTVANQTGELVRSGSLVLVKRGHYLPAAGVE